MRSKLFAIALVGSVLASLAAPVAQAAGKQSGSGPWSAS